MTEKPPILVTPSAVNKVKQLITEEGDPTLRLRVYIVGGGCAGFQYGFAFDAKQNADDFIIEHENTGFVVDSMSLQYLMGATVDYIENLQGSHFVVNNPNANTTCGCGSSFSV